MTLSDGTSGSERRTVVLVDDDALIREAMTDALIGAGYEVRTASDGLEGLALIRAVKPDYIILDIVLPKLDGGRLCAALRLDPSVLHIPIIVFSGLASQDYAYFPHLSADAYVAKGPLPIAAQNLLTALKGLTGAPAVAVKGQTLGYMEIRSRRIVTELLKERRHLEAALRVIAPKALEVDRDGCIAWVNAGACEILAMREGDLVGEGFVALVPPADQPELRRRLSNLVESEESVQVVTTLHFDSKPVSVRLVPIIEDMACSGILVILEGEADESMKGS